MMYVVRAALSCAALFVTSTAFAQQPVVQPVVLLSPPQPARWDAAGYVGWLGTNAPDRTLESDRWYDAASLDASAAFYLTRHLKLEADVSTTAEGRRYVYDVSPLPGEFGRYGEQRLRSTTASGALAYQFLENAWFHPFLGAGIEMSRTTAVTELRTQPSCPRSPCVPPAVLPPETSVNYEARPFVTTGFKAYLSPRAFFRSDLRVGISGEPVESARWRAGFGVDF
jgi:opacity protein-like surface antigen